MNEAVRRGEGGNRSDQFCVHAPNRVGMSPWRSFTVRLIDVPRNRQRKVIDLVLNGEQQDRETLSKSADNQRLRQTQGGYEATT